MSKYAYLEQQLQLLDKLSLEFYWRTHEPEETKRIGHQLITMFETAGLSATMDIDLDNSSLSVLLVKIDQEETSLILGSEENLSKAWEILEQIKNYYPVENDNTVITTSVQQ
jgi:hypothetical protein